MGSKGALVLKEGRNIDSKMDFLERNVPTDGFLAAVAHLRSC